MQKIFKMKKGLICLKQLKLKEKQRNETTYGLQINLSSRRATNHYFSVFPAIVMRINNPPNLNIMIQVTFVRSLRVWNWISVRQKYWFDIQKILLEAPRDG